MSNLLSGAGTLSRYSDSQPLRSRSGAGLLIEGLGMGAEGCIRASGKLTP